MLVVESLAPPTFSRHGPATPILPVVISVPHAGRYYAPRLLANAAVPLAKLRQLEDRYVDLLIAGAIECGATAFVSEHARAWIDLNRDPREIDPGMLAGALPPGLVSSTRARNGLGLIPRRLGDGVDLWRCRLSSDDVAERIATCHEAYHRALSEALTAARARFGVAVLLDCHSMPPLRQGNQAEAPQFVIGDRFGRSASSSLVDLVESVAMRSGYIAARNTPYAGGYSLDRHGMPRRGIHAIQLEIDRSRYLDAALDIPAPTIGSARSLITQIFESLCSELCLPRSVAAE